MHLCAVISSLQRDPDTICNTTRDQPEIGEIIIAPLSILSLTIASMLGPEMFMIQAKQNLQASPVT